ncbi:DUF4359 domain-containing protein [Bacillus taeanensis]|uniref:DUF4359 domain-containing protein n=1 Tax=Bacillus taeanensis TaxID=273032 RepID=UPI0015F06DB4|nr:DUF4359 domain-containing protein [Bacillus taeanensis]
MSKKLIVILCVTALFFLCAFTNPDQEDYTNWAVHHLKEDKGILINLGTDYIAKPIINSSTETKDFLFFSIFQTSYSKDNVTKTIGFFNTFITFDKQNNE